MEDTIQDTHPLLTDFPNESMFTLIASRIWKFYFDGSHTNHGVGLGILFVTPSGDSIPKSYKINFPCTNNMDGYEALMTRLCIVVQWKITNLFVYGDSQLIVNQVKDEYKISSILVIIFEKIPRLHNRAANAMTIVGSLLNMPSNTRHFE